MYCRICGEKIPDDSRFCPHCGQKVLAAEPAPEKPLPAPEPSSAAVPGKACETQIFTFPEGTRFDQAQPTVDAWLKSRELRILEARFTADSILLAGTMVPTLSRLEVDWLPQDEGAPYQLCVMLDSRSEFSLFRKKDRSPLQRQIDRWLREHPEAEIAGRQDIRFTMGWASTWTALFFSRTRTGAQP